MKIAFIHQGGPSMATYRFRVELPQAELIKMGHEVSVNGGEADTVIFSKPMLTDYEIAQDVKKQGARIVVDLTDDHLTHPMLGPLYKQMVDISDILVSPTKNMAERVYRVYGKVPEVIGDPYGQDAIDAHVAGQKLLWFGHMVNLKDLKPWEKCLNGITILTGPKPIINDKPHKKLATIGGLAWEERFHEWSREAQSEEMAKADIVVLPTRRGAEYKSNHRLLDAVRGGCFVVCGGHPSHDEFRKMLWVGDIKAGLDWTRAFEDELNDRVNEAKAYIEKSYSPAAIARRWQEVLQ